MQVMVCKSQIGWRSNATKIVLFATDDEFHLAGDGKLAGIVEPNDESCHLDGAYVGYKRFDYPSINQIDSVSRENGINIIFAVTRSVNATYQLLSKEIELSSVETLQSDAKNLESLIVGQYDKITSQH